ncbi:hypothetical protein [Parasitella parasitica]|uniref:Uncharacterized protein n=1 Tax=Parasitella parasitica TaxID=35722 RepID=A0A0B7N6B8_9FUNG|nr:hypothetical protein [Parasitella parasitica]
MEIASKWNRQWALHMEEYIQVTTSRGDTLRRAESEEEHDEIASNLKQGGVGEEEVAGCLRVAVEKAAIVREVEDVTKRSFGWYSVAYRKRLH